MFMVWLYIGCNCFWRIYVSQLFKYTIAPVPFWIESICYLTTATHKPENELSKSLKVLYFAMYGDNGNVVMVMPEISNK